MPSGEATLTDDSPPAESGGYVFDLDGIDSVLASWRELEKDLDGDLAHVRHLLDAQGPGDEPASNGMALKTSTTGSAFETHHAAMRTFVRKYIEDLETTRLEYLAQDAAAAHAYRDHVG